MLDDLASIWLARISSVEGPQQTSQMLDMLDRFPCPFAFVIVLPMNSIIEAVFAVGIVRAFARIENSKVNELMYEILVFIVLLHFDIVKLVARLR